MKIEWRSFRFHRQVLPSDAVRQNEHFMEPLRHHRLRKNSTARCVDHRHIKPNHRSH